MFENIRFKIRIRLAGINVQGREPNTITGPGGFKHGYPGFILQGSVRK
jgi:hypothetical protein